MYDRELWAAVVPAYYYKGMFQRAVNMCAGLVSPGTNTNTFNETDKLD